MKYIFFGSPFFAVNILRKLVDANFVPLTVVTNPDRQVGRKKVITPAAVKSFILESFLKERVTVFSPEKLDKNFIDRITALRADFFVVAAYGKIIPREILAIPLHGVIGVHPSLLPKYRGASPIQSALLAGEEESGVTLYLLDEKMDSGPIIATSHLPIANSSYAETEIRLADLGGELLVNTLSKFMKGELMPLPQNDAEATYTKKFLTEDGFIDPETLRKAQNGVNLSKDDMTIIERKIRALNPSPGVWTYANALTNGHIRISNNKRVKLLKAKLVDDKLKLEIIQVEGKKPLAL